MPWETQKDNTTSIGPNKEEGQKTTAGGLLIDRRRAADSYLYTLITKSGEELQIWGCAAIDSFFRPHHIGKFVNYRYLATVKTRSGRDFKQIEVRVWEGDPEPKMKEWPHYEEYQTYSEKGVFDDPPDFDEEEDEDAGLPF